jgi:hypothetical protein
MIMIGIAGSIGHGKTTLAEDFIDFEPNSIHLESSALIASIVNDWQKLTVTVPDINDLASVFNWVAMLPEIMAENLHTKIDPQPFHLGKRNVKNRPDQFLKLFNYLVQIRTNPKLIKTTITYANKLEYRSVLQWLGGFVQLNLPHGILFHELARQAESAGSHGTKLSVISGVRFPADVDVIHSHRGYIVLIDRPSAPIRETDDPTERERNNLTIDSLLLNNADLKQLYNCAKKIYSDMQIGQIEKSYEATQYN